jgi:hypothetical protein
LPEWPKRIPARPVRQAGKICDSEIHLHYRIISPLIGVALLNRGMRRQPTVASLITQGDSYRVEALRDGHICTPSQVVCYSFGRIQVHKSLLNVVLLDQLPDQNAQKPAVLPVP